jgi:hypothetical protein
MKPRWPLGRIIDAIAAYFINRSERKPNDDKAIAHATIRAIPKKGE